MHNKEPTDVKTSNALPEEKDERLRERWTAKAKIILENTHPAGEPPEKRTRTENRFWNKVDIKGHDECWEWQASIGADGYGTFWLGDRVRRAHRVAVMLTNDDVESLDDIEGDVVKHSCDTRACCNPQHLIVGSQRSNILEAIQRGLRHNDLSPSDVREIRGLADDSDLTHAEIAETYGVARSLITMISNGDRWGWIDEDGDD